MKMKVLGLVAFTAALSAWAADPKSAAPAVQPAKMTSQAPAMTDEQVVAQFRTDLMSKRADIMAKGLTLTAEQASNFWPLFDAYLKEQDLVVNEQISATQAYAENFGDLSDEEALDYVQALLDRDQKMLNLRIKWLEKFQKAVPKKTAARAIQLDRRLSNVAQIQVSGQIPLVK